MKQLLRVPYLIRYHRYFLHATVVAGLGGISLGTYNSMVLKQDGSLWATGLDQGYSTRFTMLIPSGVQAVAAGAVHIIALKRTGSV